MGCGWEGWFRLGGHLEAVQLPPAGLNSPTCLLLACACAGELEEGELEVDPREARKLLHQQQQQQRRPSPLPRRRYDDQGGYRDSFRGGRGPGDRGRPPPPPPPFAGRGGRGGRGGGPPHDFDYAGDFDFVSGQPAPLQALPLMGGGMMMGMLPLGAMMAPGMLLGLPPPGAGRGGFGRGGGGGRF